MCKKKNKKKLMGKTPSFFTLRVMDIICSLTSLMRTMVAPPQKCSDNPLPRIQDSRASRPGSIAATEENLTRCPSPAPCPPAPPPGLMFLSWKLGGLKDNLDEGPGGPSQNNILTGNRKDENQLNQHLVSGALSGLG